MNSHSFSAAWSDDSGGSHDDADDAFKTVAGDLGFNLVGVLLLASAAIVAEVQTSMQPVDIDPAKTPKQASVRQERSQVVLVTIAEDGTVDVPGRKLGRISEGKPEFASALKSAVDATSQADYCVRIAPDRRAAWQAILDVHEIVKSVTDRYQTVAEGEK